MLTCWLTRIRLFDFEVRHVKGATHTVPQPTLFLEDPDTLKTPNQTLLGKTMMKIGFLPNLEHTNFALIWTYLLVIGLRSVA